MTIDLVNKLKDAGHESTVLDIEMGLNQFGLTPDFENIYTVIESLANPIQGVKNSGPFTAFIAHKFEDFNKIKSQPSFKEILKDFRRIIFEECSITSDVIEAKKTVYDQLFKIVSIKGENRILSSEMEHNGETIGVPCSRTIVTTNYDMSVELYYANINKMLCDGFSSGADKYIEEFNPKNYLLDGNTSQWLIKLHGSIWQFEYNGKYCKSISDPENLPHRKLAVKERMMIYPVGEKPILKEPYYTFYKIFKEQPWMILVTIGHSFRDLPINIAIQENLLRDSTSRLIIIDREPELAIKNLGLNEKYNDRIISIKEDFGHKQTFDDLNTAMYSANNKKFETDRFVRDERREKSIARKK